jgi:hypothetical protein
MNTVQEPPGCFALNCFDFNFSADPAFPSGSARLNTPLNNPSSVSFAADVSLRPAGLRTFVKSRLREIQ